MANKRVMCISLVPGCAALLGLFAYRVMHGSGHVVVRVSNQGDAAMRNVTIFVTGRSYGPGSIEAAAISENWGSNAFAACALARGGYCYGSLGLC
jgi:hypothetical protein